MIAAYPVAIGLVSIEASQETLPALSSSAGSLLWSCTITMGVFAAVMAIAWAASRATRDDLRLRWRGGFWPLPMGIGYSIALRLGLAVIAIVAGLALYLFHGMSPDDLQTFVQENRPNVEAIVDVSSLEDDPVYFWLMVTFVSFVVAGLREELWRSAFLADTRAIWPRFFGSRLGEFTAVLLAAIVFGLGHLPQGPVAATMAGMLGVGLGIIMVCHRSIWPAVIAHGCFDATSFALIPLAMDLLHKAQPAIGQ